MKKIVLLAMLYSMVLVVGSCNTSMEEDAARMAELQCKQMKATMGGAIDAIGGDLNSSGIKEHQNKLEKFSQKMMAKYDDLEERQKFAEITRERLSSICL